MKKHEKTLASLIVLWSGGIDLFRLSTKTADSAQLNPPVKLDSLEVQGLRAVS